MAPRQRGEQGQGQEWSGETRASLRVILDAELKATPPYRHCFMAGGGSVGEYGDFSKRCRPSTPCGAKSELSGGSG